MREENLTFENLKVLYGTLNEKLETSLTFQEILESLPKKPTEQIENEWQEAVRYYAS